jgi:WD40 repeat protein
VVRIWDPATGTPLRELTGRTNKVNLLGFSSDGQLLAPRQGDTQSRFPSSGVI